MKIVVKTTLNVIIIIIHLHHEYYVAVVLKKCIAILEITLEITYIL